MTDDELQQPSEMAFAKLGEAVEADAGLTVGVKEAFKRDLACECPGELAHLMAALKEEVSGNEAGDTESS